MQHTTIDTAAWWDDEGYKTTMLLELIVSECYNVQDICGGKTICVRRFSVQSVRIGFMISDCYEMFIKVS